MKHLAVVAFGLLLATSSFSGEKTKRVPIKLVHKGDVFGKGGEWDKQYAREALQIFKDLKPDPAWEARLKALPDNTWMPCKPVGPQVREDGHGEVPMAYIPQVRACFIANGCGNPGYSSDTWLYKTGANRWVQMWPNWIKGTKAARLNRGPYPTDRPAGRCSLGIAYDAGRGKLVLHGGANAGLNGRITWEYAPLVNRWEKVAPANSGHPRHEDNCLGFAPGFGALEIGGNRKTARAATWLYDPKKKWRKLTTRGSPPGGNNCRLVWASRPKRAVYFAQGQLWTFDPKALTWKNITPEKGPRPVARERHGIAYDSANDVIVVNGGVRKTGNLWAYSFKDKNWSEMKPPKAPDSWGSFCYDPEYNVFVAAHPFTWVYRYKRAAGKKGK